MITTYCGEMNQLCLIQRCSISVPCFPSHRGLVIWLGLQKGTEPSFKGRERGKKTFEPPLLFLSSRNTPKTANKAQNKAFIFCFFAFLLSFFFIHISFFRTHTHTHHDRFLETHMDDMSHRPELPRLASDQNAMAKRYCHPNQPTP